MLDRCRESSRRLKIDPGLTKREDSFVGLRNESVVCRSTPEGCGASVLAGLLAGSDGS